MRKRILVILKPEGKELGLTEQVIEELQALGLTLVDQRAMNFFEEPLLAHELYATIKHKPYYNQPVLAIQRGPVDCLCFEGGEDIVEVVRGWLGPTYYEDAMKEEHASSFRGRMYRKHGRLESDFFQNACNFVHASSSLEDADREIVLIFPH